MSSKKIDHYRARGIANDVAEKAFEHLTKPLNDKINKLGRDAYNELVKKAGLSPSKWKQYNIGIFGGTFTTSVSDGKGNSVEVRTSDESNCFMQIMQDRWNGCPVIENEAMYMEYIVLSDELQPVKQKQQNLEDEIRTQIEGRTYNHVMKTWPEITPFLGIEPAPEMTQPFEALLSRYLPALPAPKE